MTTSHVSQHHISQTELLQRLWHVLEFHSISDKDDSLKLIKDCLNLLLYLKPKMFNKLYFAISVKKLLKQAIGHNGTTDTPRNLQTTKTVKL